MFYNNHADYGSSVGSENFTGYIDLTDCLFDVYDDEEEAASSFWIDISNDAYYDMQRGLGYKQPITDDVYVDPVNGNNDWPGTSSDSAFQTIQRAQQ